MITIINLFEWIVQLITVFIESKLLLICMSCSQYLVNVNALEVFSYCDFVESFKSISMKKNN